MIEKFKNKQNVDLLLKSVDSLEDKELASSIRQLIEETIPVALLSARMDTIEKCLSDHVPKIQAMGVILLDLESKARKLSEPKKWWFSSKQKGD